MIATRPTGAVMRYRLLDTTRAYVLDLGIADAERADLAVRHATYYRRWIEETGSAWPTYSTGKERAPHFTGLNRSEEHTSELQSLMRISYAVFCWKKKKMCTSRKTQHKST